MTDRVFLDTNVLVYVFDRDAPAKQRRARDLLERHRNAIVLSTQVLQEFYVTVTRKLGRPLPEADAEATVRDLTVFDVVALDTDLVLRGIARARANRLSIWDALVIEAALTRGCTTLLSEDLQAGRRFGPLRVENPFAAMR